MRTIAIVNQKGGCGKTTTAINLAALYAKRGLRTLLVDMDPQSHCAAGLGVPEARIEYSIGDALLHNHHTQFDPSVLVWEVARNLELAPSTMMLSALEAPGGGLHSLTDKDRRLEKLLAVMAPRYDRCLIDCPPTIGLLTFNALRAARETLVPVETGFFSLRGAEKQWNTIQRMIAHIGRPIACHLLATLHKPESQLACNILAALRRQFAGQLLPSVIHEHESLREAASFGQPVIEYSPGSEACRDFETLADWLEEHASNPPIEIEVMASHSPGPFAGNHGGYPSSFDVDSPNGQVAESLGVSGPASAAITAVGSSRAAELARRMHDLTARAAARPREQVEQNAVAIAPREQIATDRSAPVSVSTGEQIAPVTDSRLSSVLRELRSEIETAQEATQAPTRPRVDHLFGVRQTSRGVLFVQPAHKARSVSIAGEFNHWSATATPMRFNTEVGVYESIVELPPGNYQYRIVLDGQWVTDTHNTQTQLNSYGEPNSVVIVT